ncbi:MAG: alpha/beta hydrolase [Myxococcota bacterium]|nr:alpha/beta hydrolase [Myxococcota bacterium]
MRSRILSWPALFGVALLVIGWMVLMLEDAFIYFPTRYPEGDWNAAGRGPCVAQDVYFEAADGVKTHGWFLPVENAQKVLVYYHGNAGSIADRYDWGCQLLGAGASVLMVDYRGYGRSEGSPGERGFYRDIEAVWSWLTHTRGYKAHQILVYGKSLGGGLASEWALRHPPGALILQSTFTNIPDMAAKVLPFVPKFLIRTRFDTLKKLAEITCPVLVIHSRHDEIIPFVMGEKLADRANNLQGFMAFSDYGHNDLIWGEGSAIVQRMALLVEEG